MSATPGQTDDEILEAMLVQAERLCQSDDPLLQGQYRHLRERIRALIELRLCARTDLLQP